MSGSGDRQMSPVGRPRRFFKSKKSRNVIIALVGLGAAAFVIAGINAALNDKSSLEKAADPGASLIGQVTPPPPMPPQEPKTEPAAKIVYMPAREPAPPKTDLGPPPINYVMFPAGGGGGERMFDVPPPVERKEPPPVPGAPGGPPLADPETGKTTVDFKPSTVVGGRAGKAIRLTYVMTPQLIPCALDTAMDSTLAGAISCHTTQDVLSPEHVLLMPTGTVIMGTYKNDIKVGQNRLYAFSGNAITKEGIPIPLDSSVADSLGRAGIGPPNADIDHHYPERFGAALMLTALDAAVQLGQAELSKGNTTNLNFNGGGGGGSNGISTLAQQILQSQINIPPTISVPPGAIVSIIIDHPISFEDVIKVGIR